ncbi:MAG TPA: rhamnogalacturonan acetylesterase, partial [Saprospiraceae bacterium]|nr:rhamnogalacturonan acetylesterase [Saprospiraceae bacterium]
MNILKYSIFFSILFLVSLAFPIEKQPRFILIGDSTMAPKQDKSRPEMGWGEALKFYLNESTEIINLAKNGRSTQSFISSGEFEAMTKLLQSDDFVLIQYGHNDAKVNDPSRYAAAESLYKKNLETIIKSVQNKKAIPVLMTSVVRRKFDSNGQLIHTHGNYLQAVKDVAQKNSVLLLDMEMATRELVTALGPNHSKKLFLQLPSKAHPNYIEGVKDDTHFSSFGANEVAKSFIKLALNTSLKIEEYLKKSEFGDVYEYKLPTIYTPNFRQDTLYITDYGAKQGVENIVTHAIQNAIDSAHHRGGGVVV